jgi:hypothetical protein
MQFSDGKMSHESSSAHQLLDAPRKPLAASTEQSVSSTA